MRGLGRLNINNNQRCKQAVRSTPEIFKKLKGDIWDKTTAGKVVVVSTHGFVKKTSKVPDKEIDKAIAIRNKYFED